MTSPRPEEPVPASGRQVELVAGGLRVTVVEVGGGVRAFTNGAHVMAFTGDDLPDPVKRRRSLGVEPMGAFVRARARVRP